MKDVNKCPIPDSHSRLNQAFSIFENILEDYQDELRFTSALNNLIQNLRNVTFVLQKELAHKEGFTDWYMKEQEKMKKDDLLKWLIDARNYIVKQGDLKKKSYAKARLKNHYDYEIISMEVSPDLSIEEIASFFRKNIDIKVKKNLLKLTIIEIEKVWIIEDYPKAEIVDILIYCFGVLTNVVYRAHEEFLKTNPLLCEKNIFVIPFDDYMSVLHNKIRKGRVVRINYETGESYQIHAKELPDFDEKTLKNANEHYGGDDFASSIIKKMNTPGLGLPFNNLQYHIEMAKHLFSIDGYLTSMAFLYFSDRVPTHIVLDCNDPEGKYLMFEYLAEKVEETRCEAVVIVGEAWGGSLPRDGEDYVPAHIQRKREFISIIAANPEKTISYQIEIIRDANGKASLNKEKEGGESYPMLERIYNVWRVRKLVKDE